MVRLSTILLFGTAVALSGCATLSRDECSSGNWQKIGMQDGNDGQLPERFQDHVKACSLDASEVNRTSYLAARQKGLANYCTTVRGYREGALGQQYRGVCPPDKAGGFQKGFELGRRILQAESRSSEVADASRAVSDKLGRSSLPESERAGLLQEQARLKSEYARIEAEIKRLRDQADILVRTSRQRS